jgi:hypothetical protein
MNYFITLTSEIINTLKAFLRVLWSNAGVETKDPVQKSVSLLSYSLRLAMVLSALFSSRYSALPFSNFNLLLRSSPTRRALLMLYLGNISIQLIGTHAGLLSRWF